MLGPAAFRGSYGSAPTGALRRQPLDGASRLASARLLAAFIVEAGRLVGAPVLEHRALRHGLAGQVHPYQALAIPADRDQLRAAIDRNQPRITRLSLGAVSAG